MRAHGVRGGGRCGPLAASPSSWIHRRSWCARTWTTGGPRCLWTACWRSSAAGPPLRDRNSTWQHGSPLCGQTRFKHLRKCCASISSCKDVHPNIAWNGPQEAQRRMTVYSLSTICPGPPGGRRLAARVLRPVCELVLALDLIQPFGSPVQRADIVTRHIQP